MQLKHMNPTNLQNLETYPTEHLTNMEVLLEKLHIPDDFVKDICNTLSMWIQPVPEVANNCLPLWALMLGLHHKKRAKTLQTYYDSHNIHLKAYNSIVQITHALWSMMHALWINCCNSYTSPSNRVPCNTLCHIQALSMQLKHMNPTNLQNLETYSCLTNRL